MKNILILIAFILSFNLFSQEPTLLYMNSDWNHKNDYKFLRLIRGAKILEVEYSGISADEDAKKYSAKITNNINTFDTVILGVGEDGHIASLFPESDAINDSDNIYVSNEVNVLSKWRVTATFKLLQEAKNVYLLVTGSNKKEVLQTIMDNGDTSANKLINERNQTFLVTDQEI